MKGHLQNRCASLVSSTFLPDFLHHQYTEFLASCVYPQTKLRWQPFKEINCSVEVWDWCKHIGDSSSFYPDAGWGGCGVAQVWMSAVCLQAPPWGTCLQATLPLGKTDLCTCTGVLSQLPSFINMKGYVKMVRYWSKWHKGEAAKTSAPCQKNTNFGQWII